MLTVYSKNHCPFCEQAKALLKKHEVVFEEIKIDESPEAKEFVMTEGHRTVPQIYADGKIFVEGGWQGLSKLSADEIRTRLDTTNNLGTL
jgi:glutaredoxin